VQRTVLPENHTPLQIFKEQLLTDIGGDAKMASNKTLPIFTVFYRLPHFLQRVVPCYLDSR
jgi:hypothetical protein